MARELPTAGGVAVRADVRVGRGAPVGWPPGGWRSASTAPPRPTG